MDLAGMINNGAEALHRGSMDRGDVPAATGIFDASRQSPESPKAQSSNPDSSRRPPVWAQVYRGRANRVRDERRMKLAETRPELAAVFLDHSDAPAELEYNEGPKRELSEKYAKTTGALSAPTDAASIGPGGYASLTGLAPSIAGLIPNDDQTKLLAGWIFEQTEKILDDALLEKLEVEFKMGLITDEHSGLRHRFGALSECVIDPIYYQQHRLRFKSNVDPQRFRNLETLLDKVMATNATTPNNQLARDNILARDSVYNIAYEPLGSGKSNIRVTTDDNERIVECISKKRIGDFYIAMPNSAYDLKMSLSLEHPVDPEHFLSLVQGVSPSFERNKNRLKWTAPGCDVDLTAVQGQGVQGGEATTFTKEVEIETNAKLLADAIREYRTKKDPGQSLDKFLEIIRYTMDSARYLARNI